MANYLDEVGLEELWAQIGSKYGVIFEHHWKRKAFVAAHTTETAFTNKFFEFANSSSYTSYIYYSDTVEVAADGTVSLGGDPESIMDNYQTISAYGAGKLAGKYFEVYRQRVATGEIYYFDPSATMTATTNDSYTYKYGFTISSCKKITGHADAYGEAEYLQSNSRNAYPDSGEVDGSIYNYLGIPFDNSVTAPKVATGSYAGTGTYGESNPNSLTFDFEPKFLCVRGVSSYIAIMPCGNWGTTFESHAYSGFYTTFFNNPDKMYGKLKGTSLEWYSAESAFTQLNSTGVIHHYIAIG